MKTTLDLPDDLMFRVKLRALEEHKKLKDAVAELIERGMARQLPTRTPLPTPVKLKGRGPLTTDEIEAAINYGRE